MISARFRKRRAGKEEAPAPVGVPVPYLVSVCPSFAAADVLRRFASIGRDFMDQELISEADARTIYREHQARVDGAERIRNDYQLYVEDRSRRRNQAADAAASEARAKLGGMRLVSTGGAQLSLKAQWDAERASNERFDSEEPELTIQEYREWRAEQQ